MVRPHEEKPTSRRVRLVYIILAWIPVGGMLYAMWFLMGWWFLSLVVPAVWATWDYWRKGEMFEAVDGISREGAFVPEAFREDKRSG